MKLTIGIVNNLAIAAVRSADRQFTEILTEAADGLEIRLRWFRLAGARPDNYESLEALWDTRLDGLIVTGAEPRSPILRDEPFWAPLSKTVDWAAENTHSTIWSCLATHAAVLHLDDVERIRRPQKTFGLYPSWLLAEHPMLENFRPVWHVPHSRWHDLPRDVLEARGYQIYALSTEAGVDMFAKQMSRSFFWFIQSHPEYDTGALMREYRRDIARFQVGQLTNTPAMPENYFDDQTGAALQSVQHDVARQTELLETARVAGEWRSVAIKLYQNWLRYLVRCHSLSQVGSRA